MSNSLTILYATVTGNAETLAQRAYERALNEGWKAQLQNVAECKASELSGTTLLLCIVSTWGEGDPPDDAFDFFDELQAESAPNLQETRYAILGLGDRDYDDFNAFARNLDQALAQNGAKPLMPRIEADIDFEDTYSEWEAQVFVQLKEAHSAIA